MSPADGGLFPLDEQLALGECHWSPELVKQAVWLSGLLDFAQAAAVLDEVGHVPISAKTVWRLTQRWGARAQAVEAAQRVRANALPVRGQVVPGEAGGPERLAAALDGAMVNVRQEGWKELKVGCVGQIEIRPTKDPQTGDLVDLAHTVENTYVAHLGGPEVLGQQLWAEAQRRAWSRAADTVVIGDGAPWVWNLAREHFYDSVQVVDWYHAKEHLWQAAALVEGEGTPAAHRWLAEHEELLFQGHADRIAQTLEQLAKHKRKKAKDLRQQAGYFRDNQRRMQYLALRENDYPIGSGMVESGCKQFRARFTGAGMRWSRPGVERLLPIRAAILSRRFDELWRSLTPVPLN